jgi:hypothetical protein
MIPILVRTFDAAHVGHRLVEVVCEKCQFRYYYELARIGFGSSMAPYAIGSKRAAKDSTKQAREDLDRRLAQEAELVPCPQCHWINEALISGYRRGRYRGLGKLATVIACVGTLIPPVIALVLSNGPVAQRHTVPYFLLGGPAISLTIAGLIFLYRNWLRSFIRPNKDYPRFPSKLPRGGPTALIRNPMTGELEAVRSKKDKGMVSDEWNDFQIDHKKASADEWIDYQIGRSGLPAVCSHCLGSANSTSAYHRPLLLGIALMVPSCANCARWRKRTSRKIGLITFGTVTGVMLPVLIFLKLDEVVFWVVACFLGLFAAALGLVLASHRTTPARVKFVDKPRGVIRLRFRNESYQRLLHSKDNARFDSKDPDTAFGTVSY